MVDVAQDAFQSKNFALAGEIYERIIREKGPASNLLVQLGNCLALSGRLTEAFSAFLKAFRLNKTLDSSELTHLVAALVDVTHERMLAASAENKPSILLDIKEILDEEPFLCGLCLSTVLEPTTIYCGHTFCKKCIERSGLNSCICCGKNPEVSTGFQPNVLMADIMHKLFPILKDLMQLKKEASEKFVHENYEETIHLYTAITKLSPDAHTAWSNRSFVHTKLGNYEQALEDANMAIKLRPHWAKGYYRKGAAEELLGRSEDAAISYMKCLSIDKKAHQANANLTQIVHNLLKPTMTADDPKHTTTGTKLLFGLLGAGNSSDEESTDTLSKVKALLDEQLAECDMVLHFESEVRKLDPSPLTVEMFECSLCFRLLHNPVTTPCGHMFCQHCLDRSMDHSPHCPQCRGPLAEYLAHRNRAVTISVQQILNKWFPEEVKERRKLHEDDLATFSLTGNMAEIPIFVCTIAFPTIPCPLHIFEPRYRLMMRQVMESGVRQFGMCLSTGDGDQEYADHGTMLEINDLKFFDDGRSVVDTTGGRRFRVLNRSLRDGYNTAKVEFIDDPKLQGEHLAELQKFHDEIYNKVKNWFANIPQRIADKIRSQFGEMPEKGADVQAVRLGPRWVWWVTAILPVEQRHQLSILKMKCLKDRLTTIDKVISYLQSRQ